MIKSRQMSMFLVCGLALTGALSCKSGEERQPEEGGPKKLTLAVLDPAHFHAALVQKSRYPSVDSNVYVYAPKGMELDAYLALVKQYRERPDDPALWNQRVYTGADFADKLVADKQADIVVLAGNNKLKTEYIDKAVSAKMNVLADKPMAINTADFDLLVQAFHTADSNKVILYDIMTERSEITTVLQKELSQVASVFGELAPGSTQNPSIVIDGVHYYAKQVSGKPLVRPAWFFDPAQQGNGITDVGTHLVDLVQWICLPGQPVDYRQDVEISSARLWPTPITPAQFSKVTGLDSFPGFLQPMVKAGVLQADGNGEINYRVKGVYARVSSRWNFEAKAGGDSHHALLRGTKAILEIKQGKEERYRPELYVSTAGDTKDTALQAALRAAIDKLSAAHAGISMQAAGKGWRIVIPEKLREGHEAHFARVMERYLDYIQSGSLPAWEVPCMIAKYFTTTKAVELANNTKN